MSNTLDAVRDAVLYRLGDTDLTIWTEAEIDSYLKEGYDDIAIKSLCFWNQAVLEETPNTANYNGKWESVYIPTGGVQHSRFTVTSSLEDEYDDEELEPGNHTNAWEWEYLTTSYVSALNDVPEDLYQIERAVSGNKRLEPVTKRQLESDSRYEFTTGPIEAYAMQYDGLRKFRKYRKPSVIGDMYTVSGTWGILRDPSDITSDTVNGAWGAPRTLGGEWLDYTNDGWGIPRRVTKSTMTRIEYYRRGLEVVSDTDEFELPESHSKYLRHYAMSKALSRDGAGQDTALSEHYMARYTNGIGRLVGRKAIQKAQKIGLIGGSRTTGGRPPKPRLPYHYGTR